MACNISEEKINELKANGFIKNRESDEFNCRVMTRNGRISAEECLLLAQASRQFGDGNIMITTRMAVELTGVKYTNIPALISFLNRNGLETGSGGSKIRPVVSCKGDDCRFCAFDTNDLTEKLHDMFYVGYRNVVLPHKFKIAVGGCPNNCSKTNLNDLGIIGQKVPKVHQDRCRGCAVCRAESSCPVGYAKIMHVDNLRKIYIDTEACDHCGRCTMSCHYGAVEEDSRGYRISIGGRWGQKTAIGRNLTPIYRKEEDVIFVAENAILFYKKYGIKGERFADTIERLGFENVQNKIITEDYVSQKREIIAAPVKEMP